MTGPDPERLLPGAPDPWAGSSMPAPRSVPPFAMTEMIGAEPALTERVVGRLRKDPALYAVAGRLLRAAADGEPVWVTGCGTSEHAAMTGARMLDAAVMGSTVRSEQALELARDLEQRPPGRGVLLAVSHEGGTWATNLALAAARAAKLTTILVTVGPGSPGAALADHLLLTVEQDQSWCHTVGYLSPLLTFATLAAEVGGAPLARQAARALVTASVDEPGAERMAEALAGVARLLVIGSGIDYPAARELALKVEEGARLPAHALQLETLRHGHLAAVNEQTGLVLLLTDAEGWGASVRERAAAVLRSAQALAMPAAAIVAADLDAELPEPLTPAGRLRPPIPGDVPRLLAAPLAIAIPLQLLAERLARARGVEPDTIGRSDPRQAAAAEA